MKQEAEGARLVLSDLANLAVMHPDWTARLDAVDRSSVMLGPLLELLQSAPNEFAKGMLFGQLHMKAQEISNEISRTIGCRD